MLVKFSDIYIARGRTFSRFYKQGKNAETVPITKAGEINFDALFQPQKDIDKRVLQCVGKEIVKGRHILFARPSELHMQIKSLSTDTTGETIPVSNLNTVSPQFLYYYLYLKKNQITTTTKEGPRISLDKLSRLMVPIPNIAIQKNIIAGLKPQIESAEASAKNIQKEIDSLKKKNSKVFQKAFRAINHFRTFGKISFSDTKILAIHDAGLVQAGKTPNGSIKNYFGKEYPFYNQTAFEQGMNIHFANRYLSVRGMMEARLFEANSILVCFIGAQFGKAGIARTRGACNAQILSITPYDIIVPEYLYYQIISEGFQLQMEKKSTHHAISKADFEDLFIEVPSIKKQLEIIDYLRNHQGYFDKRMSELSSQLIKSETRPLEKFSGLLLASSISS